MLRFNKRKRGSLAVKRSILRDEGSRQREDPAECVRRSWERCGDAFAETPAVKDDFSSLEKKSTKQAVPYVSSAAECHQLEGQDVHIAWSSSESDVSDSEAKRPAARGASVGGGPRLQAVRDSYNAYLRMITTITQPQQEEQQEIEWESDCTEKGGDSEVEISDCESVSQHGDDSPKGSAGADVDISDCSSGPGSPTATTHAGDYRGPTPGGGGDGERSASHWARSLQALLKTPQKQEDRSFRTPEDSAKKKRTFLRGGLAERLSKLLRRQRSAVSFWRHQTLTESGGPADAKPGGLVLELQAVWEECGLRLALCRPSEPQPPQEGGPSGQLLVLFDRDTAAHLLAAPGDRVHVRAPWQKLTIEGQSTTVILNTHFSLKAPPREGDVGTAHAWPAVAARFPCPLARAFSLAHRSQLLHCKEAAGSSCQPPARDPETCDSLLDLMEARGRAGCLDLQVEVVVQRVYCLPLPEPRLRASLPCLGPEAVPSAPTLSRLCLLVQDVYGVFCEVQLHTVSPEVDDVPRCTREWEGRLCVLRGVKTVQRLTRARSTWLFSLIDSLWPPAVAPRGPGASQACLQEPARLQPPNFCYLLKGGCGQGAVQVLRGGSSHELYLPAVPRSLSNVLQGVSQGQRCTFTASVVYHRQKSATEGPCEFWLFVTDSSLQDGELQRTVPVYISGSCSLLPDAARALQAPSPTTCCLTFRDAIREHGAVLCAERSLVQLHALQDSAPVLAWLDPLGPDVAVNTLCSVRGVIVGVDENTAYSWPTCNLCGSEQLEADPAGHPGFFCRLCDVPLKEPVLKMQLEVFLSCPSLSQCTVKMKLIQETIQAILSWADCGHEGYQVEGVLGAEVGPLSAYVRVVMGRPATWIGLEEISICSRVSHQEGGPSLSTVTCNRGERHTACGQHPPQPAVPR
ncbi:DNA repair-scaffolding protein isoform X2 [Brienomyrus brachyistius]|uniref:DNA repair-scaffolding protein isoform X2 n=1 Tax=Brienomyrus brachyistius TaxID=42636 RepID=UPI0020B305FA|nr:DNA repair-scaffolding protein isoform X2 [Brienomyrus brachyistius]